jgi:hypothetical protein
MDSPAVSSGVERSLPIAVVGGGIGGSAVALALVQRGLSVGSYFFSPVSSLMC